MSYLDDLYDLEGKVAVLIGGTSKLSSQIALGLAQAGVSVVLAGRNEQAANERIKEIAQHGGHAYFAQLDLVEEGSLYALLDFVVEQSGKVDILINGASANACHNVDHVDISEVQTILDINFTAAFQACKVFGEYFIEHSISGSIINLGSIAAHFPLANAYAFSASKAALHNLTRNLAREWAENDIRVNTLSPGFIPSAASAKCLAQHRTLEILRDTPMSRLGSPEELVGAALLLASSKAGSFITGSEITVDGGFSCHSV